MWVNPLTHNDAARCPWLRKALWRDPYRCRIYELRPEVCIGYPVDPVQAACDGCEMVEESGMTRLAGKVQRDLGRILGRKGKKKLTAEKAPVAELAEHAKRTLAGRF